MVRDRMQKQRFELKYLISEETALKVREFVTCYLDFDEYSVGKPNYSYPVHSLYLDNDDLKTYWDTINGDKNRFKLRLRYYSTHPDTPV
jgi:SPX domain protein involved in polyphosphate accumulation